MASKIEKLIVKYLTKSATSNDLDDLSEWIKEPSNKIFFKGFVQTHYVISYSMNNPDTKKVLEQLLKSIKKEKSLVYKLKNKSTYRYIAAAMLVGLLVSVHYLTNSIPDKSLENNIPVLVNTEIEPGTDKATLTLGDGTIIALEKGKSYAANNLRSNGEKLIYDANHDANTETAYNYLTIPRGGQFHVVLSDGTEVWLNSESQLKYPVRFNKGETRNVELLYGEAYFKVSPSYKHDGAKFKVLNIFQEIEVLGTQFNMKAYKDETHIYTTLVEGEVAVTNGASKQNLAPNEQLILDVKNNATKVSMVDVKGEIAWIHGDFIFQHKPLEEIMKVLSRWYDVEIEFQNESLKDIKFNGELSKHQKLEEILLLIKNTNNITNYEINDKKIILK
tara:strand:- start:3110 stop:4279 length:1170 start_codon:yes stop_codon:yes gene_type:complete